MAMAHNGLAKLSEECGELQQIIGKLLAYPEGVHPDGEGPLMQRLENEMADVLGALRFVALKFQIDSSAVNFRANLKVERFKEWDKQP